MNNATSKINEMALDVLIIEEAMWKLQEVFVNGTVKAHGKVLNDLELQVHLAAFSAFISEWEERSDL